MMYCPVDNYDFYPVQDTYFAILIRKFTECNIDFKVIKQREQRLE